MSEVNWRPGRRVAIAGGGPGGVSAALAFLKAGFDVKIFERKNNVEPIGGAVLLSIPVLMILREYGVDLTRFTAGATMWFTNHKGKVRARLPASRDAEVASGIERFSHGVLRSEVCRRMADLLPAGVVHVNHGVAGYCETATGVQALFEDQEPVEADILIGADGIRSKVARQAFGDPNLFHLGIKVWLAHCGTPNGMNIPRDRALLSHSSRYQASHFPLIRHGEEGFEWWIVEKFPEGTSHPADPKAYVRNIVKDFDTPIRDLVEITDFSTSTFQWEIYNRSALQKWSKGRVACLGDAVHPVSPYAGYGLGMAVEDGYFIARSLRGCDLRNAEAVRLAFNAFEDIRVNYVNTHVAFAQKLGHMFHKVPAPLSYLRDFVFDRTSFLQKSLSQGYTQDVLKETMDLRELHVVRVESLA
ncbi:NAD(P)/FAD-dependent oxidoreductase (plasmid) [Burkholderia gladioli pv. gladioli]|uniref:FAD binding domain protein n=1 Tax=Burkholderia gladioli TaxID=28095 RepID=A0AAW3ESA5_BURGA|nr:NAD(P)/FAD-dependent oxidoreductase [Burkholderia gladioli]AJW93748.1 FAD binding domain protein [Burkholderia gladioli]ASD84623.1 FAD-dependent monooxygenase [Burkholderia gladioli pv. gladioli]AWY49858.1 FAD-dependent monooxygenase [Burkholderia gladioli pv. gladioli]KGC09954.1 FAD binding domain protein [Burkholderia gladioli]MDJ1167744.1 NAD(P)/FAD-dependent oxidoreductase [Burkholderia gladioli pv. gladioli]